MDVIAIARELGKAIQEEPAYKTMVEAINSNDANAALQEDIEQFNLFRIQLNELVSNPEADKSKIEGLQAQLTALYEKIMQEPGMVALNDARTELEQKIEMVSQIINAAANGEDPETFEPHIHSGCSGECGSCGGCH